LLDRYRAILRRLGEFRIDLVAAAVPMPETPIPQTTSRQIKDVLTFIFWLL
jgi:hypothetical protein